MIKGDTNNEEVANNAGKVQVLPACGAVDDRVAWGKK